MKKLLFFILIWSVGVEQSAASELKRLHNTTVFSSLFYYTSIMRVAASKILSPNLLHTLSTKEYQELRQVSYPMTHLTPDGDDADLKPFDQLIDNATVVALGEGTHGTHEFFVMRHRLLRYLVMQKGFRIFAIESSMSAIQPLNEYVLYGKGDPKELITTPGNSYWINELLDIVEWMREYNQKTTDKVQFFGFNTDETPRDHVMAKNIQWILAQNPGTKMVIWAHNGHIQKKASQEDFYPQEYTPMGYYLSRAFGKNYKAIGFATYQGAYNAMAFGGFVLNDYRRFCIDMPPALEGTFESIIHMLHEPIVLVNLDLVHQKNAPLFLLKSLYWRNIGAVEVPIPFYIENLSQAFDGVIYIENTRSAEHI